MSLVLQQFGVAYGARPVVRNIDVAALPEGRIVALAGANGAGKSSTLRALAGLCRVTGQALLDGEDLAAPAPASARPAGGATCRKACRRLHR